MQNILLVCSYVPHTYSIISSRTISYHVARHLPPLLPPPSPHHALPSLFLIDPTGDQSLRMPALGGIFAALNRRERTMDCFSQKMGEHGQSDSTNSGLLPVNGITLVYYLQCTPYFIFLYDSLAWARITNPGKALN